MKQNLNLKYEFDKVHCFRKNVCLGANLVEKIIAIYK